MCHHELLDMSGNKVAEVKKKQMAMRVTFHLYTGFEMSERRATLNLRSMKCKKKAHVYLYEDPYPSHDDPTDLDNMKPALKIQAENWGNWIKVNSVGGATTFFTQKIVKWASWG